MYLSCYSAAEYLASRDDWDGKTLVVCGGSQGGLQSVMTAAIEPKITAVMADVPAGCDLTGPVVDRACGWPGWYNNVQGKDAEKVRNAGRYFDVVNFASRVKVPTLVGVGLIDTTCPPSGVMAMFNQLGGPKELVIMPGAGHSGAHKEYYARMGPWQSALLKGNSPPVKQQAGAKE
jgi:cephalosporin-C deacetylase-like acetyl esterase